MIFPRERLLWPMRASITAMVAGKTAPCREGEMKAALRSKTPRRPPEDAPQGTTARLRRQRQRRGDRRDPALSKQLILSAARDEFAEYGLNGARVDRIAQRVGASKNLIYHYFGSKDRLYLGVLEDIYRN